MITLLDYIKQNGTADLSGLRCLDIAINKKYIIKSNSRHEQPNDVQITIYYKYKSPITTLLKNHYDDEILI